MKSKESSLFEVIVLIWFEQAGRWTDGHILEDVLILDLLVLKTKYPFVSNV